MTLGGTAAEAEVVVLFADAIVVQALEPLLKSTQCSATFLTGSHLNPNDELLARRALKKNNVYEVIVARDGAEASDYLFDTGTYVGRDTNVMPRLVLLDLQLPKRHSIEVLRRIRSDERTRLLPVVILTSSKEQRDMADGYGYGANNYVHKPVDFVRFVEAVRLLGIDWMVPNETPRLEG